MRFDLGVRDSYIAGWPRDRTGISGFQSYPGTVRNTTRILLVLTQDLQILGQSRSQLSGRKTQCMLPFGCIYGINSSRVLVLVTLIQFALATAFAVSCLEGAIKGFESPDPTIFFASSGTTNHALQSLLYFTNVGTSTLLLGAVIIILNYYLGFHGRRDSGQPTFLFLSLMILKLSFRCGDSTWFGVIESGYIFLM